MNAGGDELVGAAAEADPPPTVDELATALVMHAGAIFAEDVDPAIIDRSASFFGDEPLVIGGRALDSLDLVHVFTAIEDDLGVALLDLDDVRDIASVELVAHHLAVRVEPSRLRAYLRRWAPPGSGPA